MAVALAYAWSYVIDENDRIIGQTARGYRRRPEERRMRPAPRPRFLAAAAPEPN